MKYYVILLNIIFCSLASAVPTSSRTLTGQYIKNGAGVLTLPTSTDTIVGRATTDTLTNKTIAAGSNTITALANTNISASAAIDFSKLATLTSANILVGSAGNVATSVAVTGDVSLSNAGVTAYSAVVPIAKGGTNNGSLGVDAGGVYYSDGSKVVNLAHGSSNQVLTSQGTGAPTWAAVAGSGVISGLDLQNCGLSVTASSSILTIALKQIDGSTNPSTGVAACVATFRSSTATSGAANQRSITGALSQTLTLGTTLGATTAAKDIFLWLIDSDGAGTMKLGASSILYDESALQTTVAESFSATATNASPAVFTANSHGMANNDSVQLTGTPPTGFSTATKYFVVSKAANTFQLSATPGGTAINSSSTGSAIVVHYAGYKIVSDAVYTSMPVRLIGKLNETFVTAGTWLTPNTVALRQQFPIREDVSVRLTNSATALSGSLATIVWTNSNANGAFDTHNTSPDKTTIVVPATGKYQMSGALFLSFTATTGDSAIVYEVLVNGSIINLFDVDTPAVLIQQGVVGSDVLNLNALDLVTVKALAQQTAAAISSSATKNFISLSKIAPL